MIYSPHSPQEYGTVECIAKNSIGLQQKTCKYQITEAGPPNFPFSCQVVNQSDNALVILCAGSDQSSLMSNNWTANDVRFENNNSFNYKNSVTSSSTQTITIYPPTYYVCEVYNNNNLYLAANVSIAATVPVSQLTSNSLLSDSSSSLLDNNINSMRSSLTSNIMSNSFQMFVPNLTPNTNFKLKLFAANSKGRSDQIWLSAQTLRPAERLVDSNKSSNTDSNTSLLLRGKPMVIALLIGAGVVTLIVMALGIIAVVRVRTSSGVCRQTIQQDSRQHPSGTPAVNFECEEECDQCCDDDCCDEMLLTTTTTTVPQQTQQTQQMTQQFDENSVLNKGPPDIIPSFGYLSAGLENKNFISYGYQTEQTIEYIPESDADLHYAELSFCGQPLATHPSLVGLSKTGQQSVEYAKIEFNKNQTPIQRVNLIGGSPKFESTV